MTDQQRPSGYRGALPERRDVLGRPWIVTVITIFVLMFVLAAVGFPSSLFSSASSSPGASFSLAPSSSSLASASPSGSSAQ
jgi:hypothetical protein